MCKEYIEMKKNQIKGWNTWNTRSVLSHVYMPDGFCVNLGIKEHKDGSYLREALIGRLDNQNKAKHRDDSPERIKPGPHSYNGSYTELTLEWRGIEILVQSAVESDELVILVTPLKNQKYPATLVVEAGVLWNRDGYTINEAGTVYGVFGNKKTGIYTTAEKINAPSIPATTPYYAHKLTGPTGICSGRQMNLDDIKRIILRNRESHCMRKSDFGALADAYDAMQTCMAWDTFYEPDKDRVFTTVSRLWNVSFGGYGIFCWDNYFAAYIASLDDKALAYSNAIEITKEKTKDGFVPNGAVEAGYTSLDRSEPPVGSLVVRELYRKFKDKWLLEYLFDDLYEWNTWYTSNRGRREGVMSLGSTPFEPVYGNYWESAGVGSTFGGALEAGLDNSPMYDEIPFDKERNIMELADVGLTSLIIQDCRALADIAHIIGRESERKILDDRESFFSNGLMTLWDEKSGIFLNKRTDTGKFSMRISPNNFYPLLCDITSRTQTEKMLRLHLYDPNEFYGEWMIPSIARNDPAYPDQSYWRGRIWAPMNFLVYLGLRRKRCLEAQKEIAEKSVRLLLKEWHEHRHVHENYNGDTGEGCDKPNSDRFYFWGGLLALTGLIEEGYVDGPEADID